VYPIAVNPTIGGSGYFEYNVQLSDLAILKYENATGWHKYRVTLIYDNHGQIETVYSWNNYPFFDYDIAIECPRPSAVSASEEEKIFRLTPNPTNGLFKAVFTNEIKSGKLEVRDLAGNTVYNKVFRNEKEVSVDLSSRKEGVYIVNVTTDKNETHSEKIIKQ
jgi:hypothetical protein